MMNNTITVLILSVLSLSVFSHAEEGAAHMLTEPHHGSPIMWALLGAAVVAVAVILKNKLK